MLTRLGHDVDGPGADVRFSLAMERLHAEDEARSALLSERWRSSQVLIPEPKAHGAPGRCLCSGCAKKARARGMCDMHYRRAARAGMLE